MKKLTPSRLRDQLMRDFPDDAALRDLAEAYRNEPIVLYTGAGVSSGDSLKIKGKSRQFGLPSWLGLLKVVVCKAGEDASQVTSSDPWRAADEAVAACGSVKNFKERLREVIQREENYAKTYGQLAGPFVGCAATLKAVAAFSGRLTGQIAQRKESRRTHFTTARNPRVAAALTANYDCFLEAATSNLFRKAVLKPVTALGSLAGSLTRTPAFHIHGYVPHPFWQEERKPLVPDLVITRSDYERAWNRKDVFGTTMAPQIHYLRHYTVLFIGFSFQDQYVCDLLERLKRDLPSQMSRSHYALVRQNEIKDDELTTLGVRAIRWQEPDDILNILGGLYVAGLRSDAKDDTEEDLHLPEVNKRTHTPTGEIIRYPLNHIWQLLCACRNESLPSSLAERLRAPSG